MTPENIPFIVHESMMARQERTIRRLWILCLVIFLAFVGSNAAWIWFESQFEDEVVTEQMVQDVDTGNGNATVNGHIGDNYGTSEAGNNKNDQTESS